MSELDGVDEASIVREGGSEIQSESSPVTASSGLDASNGLDSPTGLDDVSVSDGSGRLTADEGDVAADYIEELLDICDLDGDIDIDVRNERSYISVHASDESRLRLLASPDTVNALQELTRLAVQTKTGEFSRLILDIAGSRLTRQQELAQLVDTAIARLGQGAAQAELPAMSSYERKLVHDIVAERGFVSNSEGEGRDRHTVITAA